MLLNIIKMKMMIIYKKKLKISKRMRMKINGEKMFQIRI